MTLVDPFATAPADEAQAAPEPTPAPVGADTPVRPTVAASEGKIVATFKEGTGYDASWVVVHAGSVAEADTLMDETFAAFLDKVKKVAGYFRGGGIQGQSAAPAASNPSAPPAGAVQAPGGESRQCQHGAMQFKSGVSAKNGKVWKAFFCPTPKGTPGQCEAEFLRD